MNPSSSSLNQLLQHLRCPIHQSSGQQLVHVCLNPTCKQQPLLCLLCKQQLHSTHVTSSISKFASDIENTNYDLYASDKLSLCLAKIKEEKVKFLQTTEQLKREFIKRIQDSQNHYKQVVDETEIQLRSTFQSFYGKKLQFNFDTKLPISDIFQMVRQQRNQFYDWKQKKQPYEKALTNIMTSVNKQINKLIKGNYEEIYVKLALLHKHLNKLQIVDDNSQQLDISVKQLTGVVSIIKGLNSKSTVDDIKKRLWASKGYPQDQQRLIFDGKQLEDERMLRDYNIKSGSALFLVLRLAGD